MLIGVVAHVNREDMAERLICDVDADVFNFDHSFPPSPMGCANNHIRVLQQLCMLATTGEWCVVLEDDAQPVPDFRRHVKRALLKAGSSLVGLYLGTGNPHGATQRAIIPAVEAAQASQACWIVADWFISTVGYAVHSTLLSGLIKGISKIGGPVDNRINDWCHDAGIRAWYTQPSLVDHDECPSIISSVVVQPQRRAHRYGSLSKWNDRTVEMGYARGWSPVA
jgi:GR25 family glycosyltransferase involved in LPS biosynthesis